MRAPRHRQQPTGLGPNASLSARTRRAHGRWRRRAAPRRRRRPGRTITPGAGELGGDAPRRTATTVVHHDDPGELTQLGDRSPRRHGHLARCRTVGGRTNGENRAGSQVRGYGCSATPRARSSAGPTHRAPRRAAPRRARSHSGPASSEDDCGENRSTEPRRRIYTTHDRSIGSRADGHARAPANGESTRSLSASHSSGVNAAGLPMRGTRRISVRAQSGVGGDSLSRPDGPVQHLEAAPGTLRSHLTPGAPRPARAGRRDPRRRRAAPPSTSPTAHTPDAHPRVTSGHPHGARDGRRATRSAR